MEPNLRRPTLAVIVAAVSMILLVAALIWGVTQAREAAQSARQAARAGAVAHQALCIEYANYVAQHNQGLHLLATQAGPTIHYAGLTFTRSALIHSVAQEAAHIHALSILHCKE